MRAFGLLLGVFLLAGPAPSHDIITTNLTYTRDISRIFARHCVACHAAGSSIPLTNYQQVRPWAVSIKEQVLGRSMPPWGAVKGFGAISPDGGLTQEDIMIVAAWVIGGAPQGNVQLLPPATAPPPPVPKAAGGSSLIIQTPAKLKQAVSIEGIHPLPDTLVESARLIARLPDGRIVPLLWLYRYDPKWSRTYGFRKPLSLEAGTIVESSTPLRLALELPAAPRLTLLKAP